jgi:hypothetical protein
MEVSPARTQVKKFVRLVPFLTLLLTSLVSTSSGQTYMFGGADFPTVVAAETPAKTEAISPFVLNLSRQSVAALELFRSCREPSCQPPATSSRHIVERYRSLQTLTRVVHTHCGGALNG